MNIYICSLISKKNIKFLNVHLKSLNSLKIPSNYKFKMIFIINPKIYIAKILIKKLLNNIDYSILISVKDNIPDSRNVFLKFIQNKEIQYAGFLDDDCSVDKDWLLNMVKFVNQNDCDIVGGPQKHKIKNDSFRDYYYCLEPSRTHGKTVKWIATNNCFFSKKIFSKSKVFFDYKFARVGGSDQLFFSELNKKEFLIKWNKKSFITENFSHEREKKRWFFYRNLRYGYSGNMIDRKIYGKISIIIILSKIIYLVSISFLLIITLSRKNYIKAFFLLFRALGRFIGLLNFTPKKYI